MAAPGVALALAFAVFLLAPAAEGPAAPVRTVLAKAVLPNPGGEPRYFRLLQGDLEPGRAIPAMEDEAMVFVLPGGPLAVTAAGGRTTVAPGEALRVAGHSGARFEAAEKRATGFLVICLGPAGSKGPEDEGIAELFRCREPLSGLGAGPLAFDLTQVTFPPHMPANPSHHRTGDALYVVLSGSGEFTTQGKTVPKPPGTCHFEASGMVHQWANPGGAPLVLLVANVTLDGTPALAYDN